MQWLVSLAHTTDGAKHWMQGRLDDDLLRPASVRAHEHMAARVLAWLSKQASSVDPHPRTHCDLTHPV
jgi:hypothetical protein